MRAVQWFIYKRLNQQQQPQQPQQPQQQQAPTTTTLTRTRTTTTTTTTTTECGSLVGGVTQGLVNSASEIEIWLQSLIRCILKN